MPHQSLMLLLALGDLGDSIRSFLFDTECFVQRSVLFNGVFCSTECFVQPSVLFNGAIPLSWHAARHASCAPDAGTECGGGAVGVLESAGSRDSIQLLQSLTGKEISQARYVLVQQRSPSANNRIERQSKS
ncbi:uncharacterized protein P884DRAFT_258812 [Thermothelomyces heterothallicus CBS 202.75]|uniref:uncharacterized protein n=1 Tax=Thermothelomyces heterothallicus CBS 202.75 TaxID=1149848 RepID=UPI0037428BB6